MAPGRPSQRHARAVRASTLLLAAALAALAFWGDRVLGGDPGMGRAQQLLALVGAALLCVALLPVAWNERILLLATATGASLLLTNLALHLSVGLDYATLVRIHPRWLHQYIPGAARHFQRSPENGGQTIRVQINSQGHRGAEPRESGRGGRIVVYGDSFIAGEFSDLEDTFAGRLEAELSADAGPVEVVNAGVVAYGPDQVAVRMEEELPLLAPDLVIVGVYAGNDYGDLLRNKLFRLDAAGRLERHAFVLDPALVARFETARRSPVLLKFVQKQRWVWNAEPETDSRTELEDWLRRSLAEYEAYAVRGSDVVTDLLEDHYEVDVGALPQSPSARYKRALMEQVLLHIRELCARQGVPLVLLVIPSPIDVCGRFPLWSDPARFPQYRASNPTDFIARFAADHDIPHLDLFAPYQQAGADDLYFHGSDDHWNDAGQALAAGLMRDYLRARSLPPKRANAPARAASPDPGS